MRNYKRSVATNGSYNIPLLYGLLSLLCTSVHVVAWPGMGKGGDGIAGHAHAVAAATATSHSSLMSPSWRSDSSSRSSFILDRMNRIVLRSREESAVQSASASASSITPEFLTLASCPNSCSNAGVCLSSSSGSAVCACNGGFFGADCSQSFSVSAATFFTAPGLTKSHFFTFGLNSSTASVTIRFVIADPSNYFGLIFLPDKVDGMSGAGSAGSGDCWVFGALKTGAIYVSDRFSTGRSSPSTDSQQDLLNQHTWINSTHVYVEFTRKLNTNDAHDIIFSSTPGNSLVFDWVVGNGAASDKLGGHDYAGSVGFIRVDFAAGNILILQDGVEWPELYTTFAIGGGIVAAFALLVQRDFVKRSVVGKYLRRRLYALEKPWGVDVIFMDFFYSTLNLSVSELFFTIAYICCLVVGISSSNSQYDDHYRPALYVVGHLASLHFALALLPAAKQSIWLPLFGLEYEVAVKWHRRCARFAIFFAWIHLVTQVLSWNTSVIFSTTAVQFGVGPLVGALGTLSFTCLGCCALSYCRRKNFELFFYSHYILFLLGMCLSALHSINLRWLLIVPGILWGVDLLYRFFFGYILRRVDVVAGRALSDERGGMEVTELELKGVSGPLCLEAIAGDWVYVNVPSISLLQWHPFSISSISGKKADKVSLHIMKMAGEEQWTSKLFSRVQSIAAESANEQRSAKFPLTVFVHGPYRSYDLPIRSFPVVVLVAGGIGITPIASLINDLAFRRQRNFSSPLKLYVIYSAKSLKCLTQWFAQQLSPLLTDDSSYQLKLFYTGQNREDIHAIKAAAAAVPPTTARQIQHRSHTSSNKSVSVLVQVGESKKVSNEGAEITSPSDAALDLNGLNGNAHEVELKSPHSPNDELREVPVGEEGKLNDERLSSVLLSRVVVGRPDLSELFHNILQTAENGSFRSSDIAVMACGPNSLVSSAHKAADQMGFAFHEEGFQY